MRLVQTLVVRDEVDIVDSQISYHLSAGVDFVIASDHDSLDGTREILESYERAGVLRLIPVSGEMQDGPWRTRMARLAATEHGADWVINTDADEFWMPHRGSLKETFGSVPEPHGVVFALSRHFAPRPDDGRPFFERMTVRVSSPAAINDPATPYRPHVKAAHRADPAVTISFGAHKVSSRIWAPVHHWHPADVLHFPFRSLEQWVNKGVRRARGDKPLGQYVTAMRASEGGRSADRFRSLVVDDATLERGLADGSLVVDTRLLNALSAEGPESAASRLLGAASGVVSEGVAVRDADLVRVRRRLDLATERVAALEGGVERRAGWVGSPQ